MMLAVALEETGGDGDTEFGGEDTHRHDARVRRHGPGAGEFMLLLELAEIGPLEQFGRQDHTGSLPCGLADEGG